MRLSYLLVWTSEYLQKWLKLLLRKETRNCKMIDETKIWSPNTLDWYIRFGGAIHLAGIFEENVCKFTSAYPHKCYMNFELVFSRSLLLYMHKKFQIAFAFTDRHPFTAIRNAAAAMWRFLAFNKNYIFSSIRAHIHTHSDNYKQNILQTSMPAIIRLDITHIHAYMIQLYGWVWASTSASSRTHNTYII